MGTSTTTRREKNILCKYAPIGFTWPQYVSFCGCTSGSPYTSEVEVRSMRALGRERERERGWEREIKIEGERERERKRGRQRERNREGDRERERDTKRGRD